MVNNAGIYDANTSWAANGPHQVSTDMRVLETNLVGTILGTTLALEKMSQEGGGGGGVVVQNCSVAALIPTGATSLYQASKYGVLGYVRSHGSEAERMTGVRMVAVCPGMTDTHLVRRVLNNWEGEVKFNENTRALKPQEVSN